METSIRDFLAGKSILILGFGREGQSAYDFVRKNLPDANLAIANETPLEVPNEQVFCGEDYLEHCKDYDVIIKSPGIPIKDQLDVVTKAKITSLTDLFLRFCPNPIIGVTGTKGKSTTSSLAHHILKNCGRDSILVGNIGIPCFDALDQIKPESIIVFELSSHQLEFVQAAPHIAILLNLYEEHLDHYSNAEAYYDAKKNIYRKQKESDFLIYGDIFEHTKREEIANLPQTTIDLYHDTHILLQNIQTQLIGQHNLYDICDAVTACKILGVSEDEALRAVESFVPLPHRLSFVGEYNGVKFYDDSIATAQEATINAIKSLPDTDTVILGGMDRGLDYHPLIEFIRHSDVRNVILLPATADNMITIFNEAYYSQTIVKVSDMAEAVTKAYELTEKGKTCLLSPAAASYGFYKNFEERGDDFCDKVKAQA